MRALARHHLWAVLLLLPLLSMLAPGRTAAQTSSTQLAFYEERLREGERALQKGDARAAAQSLEIACFGLLELPPRLAACLGRLAVAQHRAGSREEMAKTVGRLESLETRFGAYGIAPLADSSRAEVDQLLDAEREELGLAADSPLFGAPPSSVEALCSRGLVLAREATGCGTALRDLESCGRIRSDVAHAAAALGCRQRLGQQALAEKLFASLPANLQQSPALADLARSFTKDAANTHIAPGGATRVASDPAPVHAEPSPSTSPVKQPAPLVQQQSSESLPHLAAATLDRADALLAEAQTLAQIEESLALARAVADEHPVSQRAQRLAGEAAFRSSRFGTALTYFERAMPLPSARPDLRFYRAVSLHEVGLVDAARVALSDCVEEIAVSPWVREVSARILREPGSG